MSWYVLQCRPGQEAAILDSCRKHLSCYALDEAFVFRGKRLLKSEGVWRLVDKYLFPGYVFLQSSQPGALSKELEEYRSFLRVIEESGYLISVYQDEEEALKRLFGEKHFLEMSYGYKDKAKGVSYITDGPLTMMREKIVKIDWHRRYAQLEVEVTRKKVVVWAGVDIVPEGVRISKNAVQRKILAPAAEKQKANSGIRKIS